MTNQIGEELKKALATEDVAVIMDAYHLCVASRGIQDTNSSTVTAFFSGKFEEESVKAELLKYIEMKTGN